MGRLIIAFVLIMYLAVSDYTKPGTPVQAIGSLMANPQPTAGCIPSNQRPKKCPTFTPTPTETNTPVATTPTPTGTPVLANVYANLINSRVRTFAKKNIW